MNVKRYMVAQCCGFGEMEESPHGEFVLASDYDALAAELEAVKGTDHYQRSLDEMHLRYNVEAELDALAAELARVKAERDALASSGALVPVRIDPKPVSHDGWFMTPTGLGWWGSDKRGDPCVETQTHYYDAAHCYPVRLERWEAQP